jgi:hypothetical protein
MRSGDPAPVGSGSGTVEIDEPIIGHDNDIEPAARICQ